MKNKNKLDIRCRVLPMTPTLRDRMYFNNLIPEQEMMIRQTDTERPYHAQPPFKNLSSFLIAATILSYKMYAHEAFILL